MKLKYFNSKLEALEPVIEPWKVQVQFNTETTEPTNEKGELVTDWLSNLLLLFSYYSSHD